MTTQTLLQEAGRLFTILFSIGFAVGCYGIWIKTYRISEGHNWTGNLALFALLILNVVLIAAYEHANTFRPAVNLTLCIWVFYNVWYFDKYPIPLDCLQATRLPQASTAIYQPRSRLAKMLIDPVATKPFWASGSFRRISIGVFILVLCGYFLQRLSVVLVESDQRLAAYIQENQAKTDQFIAAMSRLESDKSDDSAATSDTLKLQIDRLATQLATLKDAKVISVDAAKVYQARIDALRKRLNAQAPIVERAARQTPTPATLTPTQTKPGLPSVTAPNGQPINPKPKRGRSSAAVDSLNHLIDSTYYARSNEY